MLTYWFVCVIIYLSKGKGKTYMLVDFKFVMSDIEFNKFGNSAYIVGQRITAIAIIDGVEHEVTLDWLKTLCTNDMRVYASKVTLLIQQMYKNIHTFGRQNNLYIGNIQRFDYDTNIFIGYFHGRFS